MLSVVAVVAAAGGVLVPGAAAGDVPRYDVPAGYVKCARATAANGFFKWASARRTTCRRASRFMHSYAARFVADDAMPSGVGGYRCRIRYWRNEEGDIYASRHVCVRGRVVVRFYGMV